MKNKHICYLCGSDDTIYLGKNLDFHTAIYKCNKCSLIQNDYVSDIYLKNYYSQKYRELRKETITKKYLEFMNLRAKSQKKFILENINDFNSFNDVLDIGAGAGELIRSLKEVSKNIYAVESDKDMIKYMSKENDIIIVDFDELFSQNNLKKFDLVMMSHVFEHINNPLEYLYNLHTIVEDNGYLFIEVPNEPEELVLHNINKKIKGIGHLFDYTENTLKKMILKSDLFEMVDCKNFGVSVNEYISKHKIANFTFNNNGIYIRMLLKKKKSSSIKYKNFIKKEYLISSICSKEKYFDDLFSEFILLKQERERLKQERDCHKEKQDKLKQERERLKQERDCHKEKQDKLKEERERLKQERERLKQERDCHKEKQDKLKQERERLKQERERLKQERDCHKEKQDKLKQERDYSNVKLKKYENLFCIKLFRKFI